MCSVEVKDSPLVINYRSLFWTVKEEIPNLSVDDGFELIERLMCSMCPSVTMILDEDMVEVFWGEDADFMGGEYTDLVKCVCSPEFYEMVEGDKDFTSDDVLSLLEVYLEWPETVE